MAIPWRKIGKFAENNETKTISFEIFIENKKLTSVEFKTIQGTYLVQLVGEYIETMNRNMKPPVFKQPKFVTESEEENEEDEDKKVSRLAFIMKQIFGSSNKKKEQGEIEEEKTSYYVDFDAIGDVAVSGESSWDSDSDQEQNDGVMMSQQISHSRNHQTSKISITSKTSSMVKYIDDDQQPGPSTSRDTNTGYSNIKNQSSEFSVRRTSKTSAISFDLNDF